MDLLKLLPQGNCKTSNMTNQLIGAIADPSSGAVGPAGRGETLSGEAAQPRHHCNQGGENWFTLS
jgi:hypothetical protein